MSITLTNGRIMTSTYTYEALDSEYCRKHSIYYKKLDTEKLLNCDLDDSKASFQFRFISGDIELSVGDMIIKVANGKGKSNKYAVLFIWDGTDEIMIDSDDERKINSAIKKLSAPAEWDKLYQGNGKITTLLRFAKAMSIFPSEKANELLETLK